MTDPILIWLIFEPCDHAFKTIVRGFLVTLVGGDEGEAIGEPFSILCDGVG
ncbi:MULTISPECIES: hypothetical protein [Bradyrhizobium]|uniref:Uncharacterized protein n=1 Tax=Bradyrhizobium elkanii TaxID=29448 RepID=A0A8I1Y1H6_BRAEL|nr:MULTISPECIES: hypothetical protein [Bradyrhizobium]MBP1290324.1 hypothetical protein [Bradyrhizobium elkanii]MCP1975458.1 hypothetical protein [Bradyrhizobium elkanii]MCS3482222.1 hypothetical protein [Bradyrhizobium elkanii]MCS3525093.1 hypothetical protein [Bradyrhizobium elkanii]MCS4075695.1 hypothetical protein [Bradyrhizobium elkanii]